jgi:hypothetical protein
MYDSSISLPEHALAPDMQHDDFEVWCKCVRRLLGWSAGEMENWPELYASGHTPRDVARLEVYGDGAGD